MADSCGDDGPKLGRWKVMGLKQNGGRAKGEGGRAKVEGGRAKGEGGRGKQGGRGGKWGKGGKFEIFKNLAAPPPRRQS